MSASVRPDPMRWNDNASRKMPIPGNRQIHHCPETTALSPPAIIDPHSAEPGWMPNPRKPSAPTVEITHEALIAASARSGRMLLGTRCRKRTPMRRLPIMRAASANCQVFLVRISARARRTYSGRGRSATTRITLRSPRPSVAMTSMASRRAGKAFITWSSRMDSASSQPP
jgi:hypothetical protein